MLLKEEFKEGKFSICFSWSSTGKAAERSSDVQEVEQAKPETVTIYLFFSLSVNTTLKN